MAFSSVVFLALWLVSVVCYWKVKAQYRWIVLLVSSLLFFFSLKPSFAAVTFVSLLVTYVVGRLMGNAAEALARRSWLWLAIAANLSLLLFFKYAQFALSISDSLLPGLVSVPSWMLQLALPVGLSFYVLQSIGYLVDVYKKTAPPETHLGHFAVFHLFFAKFLSGPIERADHFLPQVKQVTYDEAMVVRGLQLFLLGAVKKMVIADNLLPVIREISTNLVEYRGLSLMILVFLIGWQLYADFSGYTDMARGIAKTFGISLLDNFDHPYQATSVRNFWRRWHLSLSNWLRDYLYIPLGGSRAGSLRTILNIWVVFTLCGLWHGAAWNFVAWGAFHALLLTVERLAQPITAKLTYLPKVTAQLYTYAVISLSWVLFSFNSISDMKYILINGPVGLSNVVVPGYWFATLTQIFGSNYLELGFTLAAVATLLGIEYLPRNWVKKLLEIKLPGVAWVGLSILVVLVIMLFRSVELQEFVYVRF